MLVLNSVNGASMEIENATFRSWTEFQRWKEEEEANNHVYLCKPYGNTSTNITEKSYYMCQRDGPNRQHRKSGDIPIVFLYDIGISMFRVHILKHSDWII